MTDKRKTQPERRQPKRGRKRSALERLLAAPMRMHRYRNLHAQILDDLIQNNDCGSC